MAGDQLKPYYGELFLLPWAMELSIIEPCDYACSYCFAILGDRGRKHYKGNNIHTGGVKQAVNLLQNAHKRKTLEAFYLNNKYPVVMSNRTDPFGRKNRVQSIALIELFREMDIPIAFQTKGFIKHDLDFERVMALIPPSYFYVSIGFDNDELRQRVEPGATAIDYRFEMIRELTNRGHKVCVGVNPFVPEWISDTEKFIQRINDSGAEQILFQCLHMNASNVRQMTEKEKQRLHGGDLDWWKKVAGKKSIPTDWGDPFMDSQQMALEMGLKHASFSPYQSENPWECIESLYPTRLPTTQEFVYHCTQTKQTGDIVTFEDWSNWCLARFPEVRNGIGRMVTVHSWGVTKKIAEQEGWESYPTHMSFKTLLRIAWKNMEDLTWLTPLTNGAIVPAVDKQMRQLFDSKGMALLAFAPPPEHCMQKYEGWIVE